MFDIIARESYSECTFEEIGEKLKCLSENTKAWSIRMANTGRGMPPVHTAPCKSNDGIDEEMA